MTPGEAVLVGIVVVSQVAFVAFVALIAKRLRKAHTAEAARRNPLTVACKSCGHEGHLHEPKNQGACLYTERRLRGGYDACLCMKFVPPELDGNETAERALDRALSQWDFPGHTPDPVEPPFPPMQDLEEGRAAKPIADVRTNRKYRTINWSGTWGTWGCE